MLGVETEDTRVDKKALRRGDLRDKERDSETNRLPEKKERVFRV